MIKTTAMLLQELDSYATPAAKIRRMADRGQIVPIIRGLYETDPKQKGHLLAGVIYGPSYLSFEYALAWYDWIPEAVRAYTCATCGKGRKKRYETPFGVFTYRDIPCTAFSYGVSLCQEDGFGYMLATPEKALCDILYTISPLGSRTALKRLLFEDLRVDEQMLFQSNLDELLEIAQLYRTMNHRLLTGLIQEVKQHEQHD